MTFRADGTSVVLDTDGSTSGVALAFDPNMAAKIAEALNKYLPADGGRGRVDPFTGQTVAKLDTTDSRPLSEVLRGGRFVQIVGPYATATMDTPGGRQVRSLAEGSIVPGDVTAGHARHLIDVGLAKVVEGKTAREAYEAATGSTGSGSSVQVPAVNTSTSGAGADKAPAGNASREEWAAHATRKGAPEEETRAVEQGGLSRDELRAKYSA